MYGLQNYTAKNLILGGKMEPEERKALLEACYDEDKRILKTFGYYFNEHLREGTRPDDLEDVNMAEAERIAEFLRHHQVLPKRRRHKRIRYRDVYYLGNSYGLKHVVEDFIGYITNGDFIAACMSIGFLVVVPEPESPNAEIYIKCEHINGQYTRYYIAV
jgi:hypothetical protein